MKKASGKPAPAKVGHDPASSAKKSVISTKKAPKKQVPRGGYIVTGHGGDVAYVLSTKKTAATTKKVPKKPAGREGYIIADQGGGYKLVVSKKTRAKKTNPRKQSSSEGESTTFFVGKHKVTMVREPATGRFVSAYSTKRPMAAAKKAAGKSSHNTQASSSGRGKGTGSGGPRRGE